MQHAQSPPPELEAQQHTAQAVAGPSAARVTHVCKAFEHFDPDAFDWPSFVGTYQGRALVTRLLHVVHLVKLPASSFQTPAPQPLVTLITTALGRLIALLKEQSSLDTSTYVSAVTLLDAIMHPEEADQGMDVERADGDLQGVVDTEWVEAQRDKEKKEATRLDVELRGYMSNLIKESIRLTHLAFAQLHANVGSVGGAMRQYLAAREYSHSAQHHLDIGLGILEVCLTFNRPLALQGHLLKLETVVDRLYPPQTAAAPPPSAASQLHLTATEVRESRAREAKDQVLRRNLVTKIHVGKGLILLSQNQYESAGFQFGLILDDGGLGDWEGKAISTSDVALIVGICVLATGSRSRIRSELLEKTSFRTSLEDSQNWVLDLVQAIVGADYGESLRILDNAEPLLLVNPFLSPHVSALLQLIHTSAFVQYVEPFSSVRISSMAETFRFSESRMLSTLETLIRRGKIKGKLDIVDNILTIKTHNARANLIEHALKTGRQTATCTQAALLRMRIHEAGIVVDPRPLDDSGSGEKQAPLPEPQASKNSVGQADDDIVPSILS